jgi:alcohol dehydrogenase
MRLDLDYEIAIPTRIYFGLNRSRELGALLVRRGYRSALVCTDQNLVRAGILEGVEGSLRDSGVRFSRYDQVRENPDLDTVLEAKKSASGTSFDCVVGVGGGGPIDVAKAASVALTHDGDIRDYVAYTTGQKRPIEDKVLPVFAVPTTAGSGAEVSPVAVIVDRKIRAKIGFFSESLFPRAAVVDPGLAVTLPPVPTAGAGLDVLAHAFDAFVSRKATPFTDALAKGAMQSVFKYLRTAVWHGDEVEARSAMATASIMALLAIYFAKGGAVHTIGEPMGTICDLPHGYACGVAIPAMMEFLLPVCRPRFAEMLALTGHSKDCVPDESTAAWQCIHEVETLIRDVRVPRIVTLVEKPDLEALADASAEHLAVDRVPMPISREDYGRLYAELFSDGYLEA